MSYYGARNRLTKLMLEKMDNDNFLSQIDHNLWYIIPDLDQLTSIQHCFVQFNEDLQTKNFLDNCIEKSEHFFTQLLHSFVLSFLQYFMAITSINGLLQRGSMFVFSEDQFKNLIDFRGENKLTNLLDLGAGDGEVTSKMAPFFQNVYTTEMSTTMRWRLQHKGFQVVEVNEWDKIRSGSGEDSFVKFDAISCLNLLDRCDKPLSLLKQMKKALKPNGLLIVALVLPYKPYVEYNPDNKPSEDLLEVWSPGFCVNNEPCKMNKVNKQIKHLIENVFEPIGFELTKFTRLPYLCEGNLAQSYFYLIDYVFIFKNK
ncbi:methyltransferase 9 [Brachionus plicatilis]|uniref:Methyltransferase 9 n=1 Tax=Brachionus plicatilis TaxID=10195 RepID=A0A3M7SAE2_BRAPC|nr:methyltransferase 9 [Brachionus plicatilis]